MDQKSLILAGVDIGAANAKAVILSSNKSFPSLFCLPVTVLLRQGNRHSGLEKVALSFDDVQYIISTSYGRRGVSFANKAVTEIICHAPEVSSIMPQAKTVIDIGGQDSKVIELDDSGNVINFAMNDKCAAGTGRFLEAMAGVLDVKINDMGPISLTSKGPCEMSSTCTIFAEPEVVSLRAEGRSRENLLAGIHKAMSHRVVIMAKSVGFKKDVVFTGGVAKNVGIKEAMEDAIGLQILIPEEPQIMGALGAAMLAQADLEKLGKASS